MYVPDDTAEGMKALEEQRYDEAIASFTKAAEADPKDYSAYFHIGLAQSLLDRDPEAISSYRKVLELKPGCTKPSSISEWCCFETNRQAGGSLLEDAGRAETQGIPSCLLCGWRCSIRGQRIDQFLTSGLLPNWTRIPSPCRPGSPRHLRVLEIG